MKLSQKKKHILLIVILVGVGILLIWAFHEGREEFEKEKERERPVKSESRVSIENGQSIVRLDQATQMKSGITTEPLQTSSHSEEIRVQGTIMHPEDLPQNLKDHNQLDQKQDVLIQVDLPINTSLSNAPEKAWIKTEDGMVPARLAWKTPDGKFFYQAPRESFKETLWIEFPLYLPVGPEIQGVVIPVDAVVWLDGKSWVYVEKDTEHFVRREISTKVPIKNGWFVSKGFSAGEKVVTNGAQLLLSEEFRSQIKVGEEGKEENERD